MDTSKLLNPDYSAKESTIFSFFFHTIVSDFGQRGLFFQSFLLVAVWSALIEDSSDKKRFPISDMVGGSISALSQNRNRIHVN